MLPPKQMSYNRTKMQQASSQIRRHPCMASMALGGCSSFRRTEHSSGRGNTLARNKPALGFIRNTAVVRSTALTMHYWKVSAKRTP